MPYTTVSQLPPGVKNNLPKHAQEIFLEAFNNAYKEYEHDEERAFKVAWAAVKKKYTKDDDRWVAKH
jgi:cation transport regulator